MHLINISPALLLPGPPQCFPGKGVYRQYIIELPVGRVTRARRDALVRWPFVLGFETVALYMFESRFLWKFAFEGLDFGD